MRLKKSFVPAFVLVVALPMLAGCEVTVNKPAAAPAPAPTPTVAAAPTPAPEPAPVPKMIKITKLPVVGNKIDIPGQISFADGSPTFKMQGAEPEPGTKDIVMKLITIMKDNPNIGKIRVEGHTDNVGPAAYNKDLSQKRADTVKKALVAAGVDEGRVVTVGYGMDKPIAPNDTADGRAKNRRTEFRIQEMDGKPVADSDTPAH